MHVMAYERFDIRRAAIRPQPLFHPLRAPLETDLSAAIQRDLLDQSAQVLVMPALQCPRVVPTLDMVYHHVAQGYCDGDSWMLTFCLICNSGMNFSAVIDGRKLTFTERGIYNAMTLIADEQTDSLWNPLTGECLHGVYEGARLQPLASPRQMTACAALEAYPHARLILSQLNAEQILEAHEWDAFRQQPIPELPERWIKTMGIEDTRLPRLDMGLGVWTGSAARYYRFSRLNALDNLIVDTFDDRPLIVYLDPASGLPEAFYIHDPMVSWLGDDLVVKSSGVIRHGVLYPSDDSAPRPLERPDQLFVRWYGFAFTFPGCEIYS